jgi:hypothetical protein
VGGDGVAGGFGQRQIGAARVEDDGQAGGGYGRVALSEETGDGGRGRGIRRDEGRAALDDGDANVAEADRP